MKRLIKFLILLYILGPVCVFGLVFLWPMVEDIFTEKWSIIFIVVIALITAGLNAIYKSEGDTPEE